MKTCISIYILLCFIVTSIMGPCPTYAQDFVLPAPGKMVGLSPAFSPAVLKGIKLDPQNPFRFHFFVDTGDDVSLRGRSPKQSQQEQLKSESAKLIKYFLASLTIPEKDLWVNLSPYEKDRIVPQEFGQTEMGRDLLAEDYLLKQITASLIYPESQLGKKFWQKVYAQAQAKYGTTNIPINTFNKVWIVPEKAVVYENGGVAFVLENHLKVMLEQDYLSMSKHADVGVTEGGGSQIIREIVIPALTREVNEGKNFAQLRQVFYSLILATWYKKKIKDSILNKVYSDRKKINNLSSPNASVGDPQHIYQQYLQAFKRGVYNYIKEEPIDAVIASPQGEAIPKRTTIAKKYFSGGVNAQQISVNMAMIGPKQITPAQISTLDSAQLVDLDGDMSMLNQNSILPADSAMQSSFKIEVSMPGLRLNGHIRNPPPFSDQTIRDGISEFFYRNDAKNTKQLLRHLFTGEHQVTEIAKIGFNVFQEGLFYFVFRGEIELRNGQMGTFVMMAPQRSGAANQMIADDYSNLESLYNQYPEIFAQPIAYDSVLQNVEASVPDTHLNLLAVEWLGDYIEMPADYHRPVRFSINPGGREEDRISLLKLVRKPETSSVILQKIVRYITQTAAYDLEQEKVDYIDEIDPRAGDFMIKPLGNGGFQLKWITVRAVAKGRDMDDFLDYLLRSHLFNSGTDWGFDAKDIIEGIRQGLEVKFGSQQGPVYFLKWMTSYRHWLEHQQEDLNRPEPSETYRTWLLEQITTPINIDKYVYKRQVSSIRQYLETGKVSDDFKEFIQDQKEETQRILSAVEANLNRPAVLYQDRVHIFFLDTPRMSIQNWKIFDPSKRSSVKVMIIGDLKSAGVVKQTLLSQQYAAGNISSVEDLTGATTALNSLDALPEIIVFQGAHAAWQDQGWFEFISTCKLKGQSTFVGLDTKDAADDFKYILPGVEEWLGAFSGLQKSMDGAMNSEAPKPQIGLSEPFFKTIKWSDLMRGDGAETEDFLGHKFLDIVRNFAQEKSLNWEGHSPQQFENLIGGVFGIILENLFQHEYFDEFGRQQPLYYRIYNDAQPQNGIRLEFWGPGKNELPIQLIEEKSEGKEFKWFDPDHLPWSGKAPIEAVQGGQGHLGIHVMFILMQVVSLRNSNLIQVGWRKDGHGGHIIAIHFPLDKAMNIKSPAAADGAMTVEERVKAIKGNVEWIKEKTKDIDLTDVFAAYKKKRDSQITQDDIAAEALFKQKQGQYLPRILEANEKVFDILDLILNAQDQDEEVFNKAWEDLRSLKGFAVAFINCYSLLSTGDDGIYRLFFKDDAKEAFAILKDKKIFEYSKWAMNYLPSARQGFSSDINGRMERERYEVAIRSVSHDKWNEVFDHLNYIHYLMRDMPENARWSDEESAKLTGIQARIQLCSSWRQAKVYTDKELISYREALLEARRMIEETDYLFGTKAFLELPEGPSYRKGRDSSVEIIEDLLSLMNGNIESRRQDIVLADVVGQAFHDVFPQYFINDMAKKGTTIRFDGAISRDVLINADPRKLWNIFRILFTNSMQVWVERNNGGKTIILNNHMPDLIMKVEVDKEHQAVVKILEVTDNAGGIRDRELLNYPDAEQPDRQAAFFLNVSRRTGDTGLGLAEIYHLVRLHDTPQARAGIRFENLMEEDRIKGAKFIISLPLSQVSNGDKAQVTGLNKGGIDLNPAQMSLQVKKEGEDFKFNFNGTETDAAQVTGATFTIRQMTPVTNLPQILGLN